MAKRQPLCVRLYFEPHLVELVRLIGYQALPLEEARARMAPLVAKYGKDKLNAAIMELFKIDTSQEPHRAYLKPEARRSAWQLLGPPPESIRDASA
jgi:hypothetical protein